jgi:sec-independent protein translocase protein TatA
MNPTNPILALFNLGGGEIILVLAIVLILFGAKKLPELAKGLGQGINEFKKAAHNASEGMRDAIEETPQAPPKRLSPATNASTRSEDAITAPAPSPKAQASLGDHSTLPKPTL